MLSREKGHTKALQILKDEARKRRERGVIEKRNKEIELEAKKKNIQTKDNPITSSCCCLVHIFSTNAEAEERVNKEDGKREQMQKLDKLLMEEIIKPVRQGEVFIAISS